MFDAQLKDVTIKNLTQELIIITKGNIQVKYIAKHSSYSDILHTIEPLSKDELEKRIILIMLYKHLYEMDKEKLSFIPTLSSLPIPDCLFYDLFYCFKEHQIYPNNLLRLILLYFNSSNQLQEDCVMNYIVSNFQENEVVNATFIALIRTFLIIKRTSFNKILTKLLNNYKHLKIVENYTNQLEDPYFKQYENISMFYHRIFFSKFMELENKDDAKRVRNILCNNCTLVHDICFKCLSLNRGDDENFDFYDVIKLFTFIDLEASYLIDFLSLTHDSLKIIFENKQLVEKIKKEENMRILHTIYDLLKEEIELLESLENPKLIRLYVEEKLKDKN